MGALALRDDSRSICSVVSFQVLLRQGSLSVPREPRPLPGLRAPPERSGPPCFPSASFSSTVTA